MVDAVRSPKEILDEYGSLTLLTAFKNSSSNLKLLEPLALARAENQVPDPHGLFREFMPEMHFDAGYCEIQGDCIMLRVNFKDFADNPGVAQVELAAQSIAKEVEEVYFPSPEE